MIRACHCKEEHGIWPQTKSLSASGRTLPLYSFSSCHPLPTAVANSIKETMQWLSLVTEHSILPLLQWRWQHVNLSPRSPFCPVCVCACACACVCVAWPEVMSMLCRSSSSRRIFSSSSLWTVSSRSSFSLWGGGGGAFITITLAFITIILTIGGHRHQIILHHHYQSASSCSSVFINIIITIVIRAFINILEQYYIAWTIWHFYTLICPLLTTDIHWSLSEAKAPSDVSR